MAREYFERQSSMKRSSVRSSSADPLWRNSRVPSFQDVTDHFPPSSQLKNQNFVDPNYRDPRKRSPDQDQQYHRSQNLPLNRGVVKNQNNIQYDSHNARQDGALQRPYDDWFHDEREVDRRMQMRRDIDADDRIRVVLPAYLPPPRWLPPDMRTVNSDYEIDETIFMPRKVTLVKGKAGQVFGFDIRGGYNLNCGVFVAVVLKGTLAEKHGLRVRDLLIEVNGRDFRSISFQEAHNYLKSHVKLELLVRNFPAGFETTLLYEKSPDTSRRWVASR